VRRADRLHAAYLATHYKVLLPGKIFTFRIAHHSPQLQTLHQSHRVNCSAFLTAWNPFSETISAQENRLAQQALLNDLHNLNIPCVPGIGVDPTSQWPGEESLLALGLPRDVAIRLGKKYRQNALVWAGSDSVPELIFLM
jgi:hypothetical protein